MHEPVALAFAGLSALLCLLVCLCVDLFPKPALCLIHLVT